MSELFDKKFVHFMWEDSLEGKEGFFADTIHFLKDSVDKKDVNFFGTITKGMGALRFPFASTGGGSYQFFYYDPNYDVKRAYNEDKQIQYRIKNEKDSVWTDTPSNPIWSECYEYRIKPYSVIVERTPPVTLCYTQQPEKYKHMYFTGSKEECSEYISRHRHLVKEMQVWEDGKQIQWSDKDYAIWNDCCNNKPLWKDDRQYRIKPEDKFYEDYRCAKCISSDKEINCGTCNVQKEYDRYAAKSEKPKSKRMTSKMLCEWLAKKNGQYKSSTDYISAEYGYYKNDEQEELPDDYKIRRWCNDEWIEPTVEEYLRDCGGRVYQES